jgi:Asp/Glu/hydantoin racemase
VVAESDFERVRVADPELGAAYAREAQALEASGATAILGDCGSLIVYQRQISAAVSIPVATSPYLFLPLLAAQLGSDQAVGILNSDKAYVTPRQLGAVGMTADGPTILVEGIQDTVSGEALRQGDENFDQARMDEDILAAAERLVTAGPNVGAIVIVCSDFSDQARLIREQTGRPVYDFVSLADLVMASRGVLAHKPSNVLG